MSSKGVQPQAFHPLSSLNVLLAVLTIVQREKNNFSASFFQGKALRQAVARGNTSGAIFNAAPSNILGVILTPLLVRLLMQASGQVSAPLRRR